MSDARQTNEVSLLLWSVASAAAKSRLENRNCFVVNLNCSNSKQGAYIVAFSKRKKASADKGSKRTAPAKSTSAHSQIDLLGIDALLRRNEKIFRAGQSARYIYKVVSGCVRTYTHLNDGRRQIAAFYFPGDYFGLEMWPQYKVFAEATTASRIRAIKAKALTARAATDFSVARHMLTITQLELQRAQNHSLLLRMSSVERVGHFLFLMKKRNRRKEVDLLITRQDIADHLNLTVESVSRALARLEKESAISFLSLRRIAVHIRRPLAA